jgi:hypothetical protein
MRPASAPGLELDQGTEAANALGRYWCISRPVSEVWPAATEFLSPIRPRHTRRPVIGRPAEDRQAFLQAFPGKTLFLDLETCGLAGSAIFLVGLIRFAAGQLYLEQLWARSHAEEPGLLGALREIMRDGPVLVTFNGKSFDWPQVRDRTTLHTRGREGTADPVRHLDLLHHARRRYGTRFGDCRLQTLERHICGRFRVADVGGSQIPAVYSQYVRTGDASLVRPILHHNALDLLTLLQLAVTLVGADENGL